MWWRDDDADAPVEALLRLTGTGDRHDVTPALAVSPALALPSLAEAVDRDFRCVVLQHGYAHVNHAPAANKKCELGDDRPVQLVLDQLHEGHQRMLQMFGGSFLPVMVPPWNRISETVLGKLASLGFTGISEYTARPVALDNHLNRCNTHVDIVDWKNQGTFIGLGPALNLVIKHLHDKRAGRADAAEPTGLLTHHRKHDGACWTFIEQLLSFTVRHPAVSWVSPIEIFRNDRF